jgi:hypothetical protein
MVFLYYNIFKVRIFPRRSFRRLEWINCSPVAVMHVAKSRRLSVDTKRLSNTFHTTTNRLHQFFFNHWSAARYRPLTFLWTRLSSYKKGNYRAAVSKRFRILD